MVYRDSVVNLAAALGTVRTHCRHLFAISSPAWCALPISRQDPVRTDFAAMRPILELDPTFDYTATFLWATSGALLAARRGYDIVGVVVIAMVSALGGGLIRDAIFLNQQPVLIRQPTYLLLVAIAVVAVLVFGRLVQDS